MPVQLFSCAFVTVSPEEVAKTLREHAEEMEERRKAGVYVGRPRRTNGAYLVTSPADSPKTRAENIIELVSLFHISIKIMCEAVAIDEKLRDYLNSEEAELIRKGYHCRNRSPWHSIKHLDKPDAFFHYMASSSPHIVLNNSEATCTNTIHRLTKRSNITKNRPNNALSVVNNIAVCAFFGN